MQNIELADQVVNMIAPSRGIVLKLLGIIIGMIIVIPIVAWKLGLL